MPGARMGRVVTFSKLPTQQAQGGAHIAAVTGGDMQEMAASYIHIAPGEHYTATVPDGSDCYMYMLDGAGTISAGRERRRFPAQSFATLEQRLTFAVENAGSVPANLVKVLAPPKLKHKMPGFAAGVSVAERVSAMVVNLPSEKKKRIYFVGSYGVKSQRGHAMIVVYDKDTVTGLHHHPNAESMFVILDGALDFIVNGQAARVGPGQAAVFGLNDKHGVRVAEGLAGASFLEFHIPAAYTTVREQPN
jgi:mannose-6-phosphate isomerase-like protein (cupin superfamily)